MAPRGGGAVARRARGRRELTAVHAGSVSCDGLIARAARSHPQPAGGRHARIASRVPRPRPQVRDDAQPSEIDSQRPSDRRSGLHRVVGCRFGPVGRAELAFRAGGSRVRLLPRLVCPRHPGARTARADCLAVPKAPADRLLSGCSASVILRYVSGPLSIRFDPGILDRLKRRAARLPGATPSGLAQRLVDEGLRRAEHPGIEFKDGPSGRRAALALGPDVWEVAGPARTR